MDEKYKSGPRFGPNSWNYKILQEQLRQQEIENNKPIDSQNKNAPEQSAQEVVEATAPVTSEVIQDSSMLSLCHLSKLDVVIYVCPCL